MQKEIERQKEMAVAAMERLSEAKERAGYYRLRTTIQTNENGGPMWTAACQTFLSLRWEKPQNYQITQMIKSKTIMALSTTHAPHEVEAGLIELGHSASEEEHAPCEAGIVGKRSRRPVEGRLHIIKRIAGR